MGGPQPRLEQIAVVRLEQVLGAPRLHENEVVPVLVAETDHQPVRRATHCLKPGRDLLLEAVIAVDEAMVTWAVVIGTVDRRRWR